MRRSAVHPVPRVSVPRLAPAVPLAIADRVARLGVRTAAGLVVVALTSGCVAASSPTEVAVGDPTAVPTTPPLAVPPPPTSTPVPATAVPSPTVAPPPTSTPAPTLTPVPPPTPTEPPIAAPAPTEPPPTTEPETEPASQPTVEPTATAVATVVPTPAAAVDDEPERRARQTASSGWGALGVAGQVSLSMPADRIELVGFHEAGHPGSQEINRAAGPVQSLVLETRQRGTSPTSAADIVVPPDEPIRAPATGTVIATNTYVLYCDHEDQLVYIEPDGLPGWQVRMFHVVGVSVSVGDRVVAGETTVAAGARVLPFESQVDEYTGEPSWPHVHVEVVDTSVPDDRPPGPGCD